ncbi:MAG: hypothetical protein ACLVAT_00795 [Lachnospiraceae bacterium]
MKLRDDWQDSTLGVAGIRRTTTMQTEIRLRQNMYGSGYHSQTPTTRQMADGQQRSLTSPAK